MGANTKLIQRRALKANAAVLSLSLLGYMFVDFESTRDSADSVVHDHRASSEQLLHQGARRGTVSQEARDHGSEARAGSSAEDLLSAGVDQGSSHSGSGTRLHLGDHSTGSTGFGVITPSQKGDYLEPVEPFEFFGVPPSPSLLGAYEAHTQADGWFAEVKHVRRLGQEELASGSRFGVPREAAHLGKAAIN